MSVTVVLLPRTLQTSCLPLPFGSQLPHACTLVTRQLVLPCYLVLDMNNGHAIWLKPLQWGESLYCPDEKE